MCNYTFQTCNYTNVAVKNYTTATERRRRVFRWTTNDERRNDERRTANGERRTANDERRNNERRTTKRKVSKRNAKSMNERTTNDERRTTNERTIERSNERTNDRTSKLFAALSPFAVRSLFTVHCSLTQTNERTNGRTAVSFKPFDVRRRRRRRCCRKTLLRRTNAVDERSRWQATKTTTATGLFVRLLVCGMRCRDGLSLSLDPHLHR